MREKKPATKKKQIAEGVQDLVYSPDERFLAVGSRDNNIYVYNSEEEYRRVAVCRRHSSYITHLDWSKDSRYLMSNCAAYEILYWDAEQKFAQYKKSCKSKSLCKYLYVNPNRIAADLQFSTQ